MNQQSPIISFHSEALIDQLPSYQADRVASILKTFLRDMDFVSSGFNPANEALESYMESLMYSRGLECTQLKRTIHLSASLIELAYHHHTLDEKKNLALFNWFAIYIDDRVTKDPLPFREFGSRLLRRQPQSDHVLTAFTEVLDRMWDFYDPLAASAILNHTLNFVTGCCIEPELEKIPLKQGIERFPWYIRDLTGVAIAFSLFAFMKRGNFDMMRVIQALPDMNFWVSVTNDLLSFHKEELANETGTYIYNRAKNDNQSRYETCSDIVAELKEARQNIHAVLADNPAALDAWKTWETGYIEWHLVQERYRLRDLGIML